MRGLNRVVRDDDLFERGDPDRDALRHTLADIGIGHFMGTLQPLDDGHYLAVALHRAVEDHADYGGAAVARLEALAPHLRQAWDITQQVQGGQRQLGGLQAHLDQLRCGLLLCDEQAQVRWLNRSARQLVQRGAALQVRDGVLRAASPAATTTLHAQIARAEAQAGFLAVGDGPSRLHLALRRTVEGGVLVAATRVGDGVAVPTAAWSRLLGVTAAEAALVATLVDGGTLEEHAQRRGVSAGTVRGQLKQVLSKTGTHRQAELVRLALSSAAAHLLDSVPAVGD